MDSSAAKQWLGTDQGQACINGFLASNCGLSRSGLSRSLCDHLEWRDARGRLKEVACRKVLSSLERVGQVQLPPQQRFIPQRRQTMGAPPTPCFEGTLVELGRVELVAVGGGTAASRTWNALMDAYHPLGSGPLCGAQIRYLIVSETLGIVGGLALSAGAWRLAARDKWLGWDDQARRDHLAGIVCNSRFLILPNVKVKNLGSQVLGQLARRVRGDWQTRYGYAPWLMETCVEVSRPGTVYRAANWIEVGLTAGRGRQDRACESELTKKRVFLYPLCPSSLKRLCPDRKEPSLGWVYREFGGAQLGDKRLEQRLLELGSAFFARPVASIPEACGSLASAKAAYRFFDNPRVDMEKLLQPHKRATIERAGSQPVVLAVEDTSSLDYTTHRAMRGLGPIAKKTDGAQGLFLHTAQAFGTDGLPLGLLDVKVWARDAAKYEVERDQMLPIEQKESYKWIGALQGIQEARAQCPKTTFVVVADREADVFEFMDATRERQLPFLVRAKTNRHLLRDLPEPEAKTKGTTKRTAKQSPPPTPHLLWEFMSSLPEAGSISLTVPRRGNVPERMAQMSVRFSKVTLKQPQRLPNLPPMEVWAIWTTEMPGNNNTLKNSDAAQDADQDAKPLEWMLLTSLPVNNAEEAFERVQWYTRRWGIEVYHRILKSGCGIEDRQLGNDDRLEACLSIDMVVAWRIHHLAYLGRTTPDVPCTVAFSDSQWKAVIAVRTRQKPESPPPLAEMIRHVAILGGFLGRKSDGHPGTQTLWKGLQRMHDFVLAFDLVQEMQKSNPTTTPNDKPPKQKKRQK